MARRDEGRKERAGEVLAATRAHWARGGHARLERPHGDGLLVVDREPELIYGGDGGAVGVDAWVRAYRADGRERRIDPHRRIINPPTTLDRGPVRDPAEAFYRAVADSVEDAPNPRGWRTAGTVTTVFAATTDGRLEGTSATYSIARAGSGTINTDTSSTVLASGQRLNTGTYSCYESYFSFDTSAIADSDHVSDILLQLYVAADVSTDSDFTCEARERDWGASLTSADYVAGASMGSFALLASLSTPVTASAYASFTSTAAFRSATNLKTGTVYVGVFSDQQRLGNPPTTDQYVQWQFADTSGTTQDPKLTITHAAPSAWPVTSPTRRLVPLLVR